MPSKYNIEYVFNFCYLSFIFFCLSFTDCDLVCDDIKEAAVHLAEYFPRSGQSTSESKEEWLKIKHDEMTVNFYWLAISFIS